MPLRQTSRLVLAFLLATGTAAPGLAQGGPGGRVGPLEETFDQIDTNADGAVTKAELAANHAAEFAATDTNADGTLSAEEIAAHHLAKAAEKADDRAARMIESRDSDDDGRLSIAEVGEGPAQRHFARLDADGNGAISKVEVELMVTKMKHRRKDMRDDQN